MESFLKEEDFCPECGYCDYQVKEKGTEKTFRLCVAKCDEHECDISLYDVESNELVDTSKPASLTDLKQQVHARFNLLSREDCNCG